MSSLVDVLGAVAGGVWISAAFYYQMVQMKPVDPRKVSFVFLTGVALMLGSSALAVRGPRTVEMLAIASNLLFIGLGLGAWYWLSQSTDSDDRL